MALMENSGVVKEEILKILDDHFDHFEAELKEVIAANAMVKNFASGEILMRPGQFIRSTMLVSNGRIKVSKKAVEGDELFMYYIEPGNACALSMICASKQEQSELLAKAVIDTTALLIPVQLMDDLMSNYKSWYYFVVGTYRERFEELITLVDQTVFKGLDERLASYLKKQMSAFDSKEIKLTHEEIATDLGTSRVVISRLLKQMEKANKVILHRNFIDISNL